MNPESMLSQKLREERAKFFQNMKHNGIEDEVFINWFWNNKYTACEGALSLSVAMMYEGWKGAKQFS
ncbi:prohead assembly scaffold protein [Escherichia phage BW-1]|nr:prohead assembly scaffold protein [Escherichia phage BW-1]